MKQVPSEPLSEGMSSLLFMINNTLDYITMIGSDYRYQAVNNAYLLALGKTYNEVVGHKVEDIWGKEKFDKTIKHHLDECMQGKPVHYQSWFHFATRGRR